MTRTQKIKQQMLWFARCAEKIPKPFIRPPGKVKPVKIPKTPEQKKLELEKYWVKTTDMMEEETEPMDQVFGDELDGIQKAVPVTVKDIRHMEHDQKQVWVKAIEKELESLINRKTFVKMTRKRANDLYWRNGIKTKDLPSKLVCCKKTQP